MVPFQDATGTEGNALMVKEVTMPKGWAALKSLVKLLNS
jgi:hypothetical protein